MLRFLLHRLAPDLRPSSASRSSRSSLIRLLPGDPVPLLGRRARVSPGAPRRADGAVRLRPAALAAVRSTICGSAAPRRLRQVLRHARSRCWTRVLHAASRRRSNCRSAPSCSPSCSALPAGIFAAVKRGTLARPAAHGRRAGRLLDADLLVGPAADHALLASQRSAGRRSRAASRSQFDIPPRHRLHADRRLLAGEPGAFRSALSHLILPAIALGTIPLAVIARMTRSAMLEVLREDYVRTARAKGLSPSPRGLRCTRCATR